MEQAPAVTPVTVVPLTVQMPEVVEVRLTARLEVDVATTVPVPPTATVGITPKVMVWLDFACASKGFKAKKKMKI